MPRGREQLTARFVANASKPGRYGDGGGLELQVSKWTTKSWLFRYMRSGKTRWLGLGAYPDVSLSMARKKAGDARLELLDGGDPLKTRREQRHAERLEAARRVTFGEVALAYIGTKQAGWKNEKHAAQWNSTFIGPDAATAAINDLAVSEIDTALVLKVIQPIWTKTPETASRIRGRIEKVLDAARVAEQRAGENPARWRGHLEHLLPARRINQPIEHHPSLPYADVPGFAADLRDRDFVSALALEFLILTVARTGEVIGATWNEINLAKKLWTIPAGRMKAGKEHIVPLSPRALQILHLLPHREGVLFARRDGKALSNMAMLELLRAMRPGVTVHGFRSSFRDWAGDMTNFARETIEFALAHGISDRTEASYRHRTAIEKRAKLMAAWANYCGQSPAAAKILPMRVTAAG